jgi:hypothetical protein
MVISDLDVVGQVGRPHHPVRLVHPHFPRAEHRPVDLLQDQAQAPGRQQRIQRAPVQVPYQNVFHQHAQQAGGAERQHDRQEEIQAEQGGHVGGEQLGRQVGDIGAQDHELAMRHVDDAHLAEDDGQPQRHQHEDGEQDQPGETLHRHDRAEIGKRIAEQHDPSSVGLRAAYW